MRFCYFCMNQVEDNKLSRCPHCGKDMNAGRKSLKYLKPGMVLQDKFIVGQPLGAGGFGNTYIGWNKVLLRKVAIKEFYPEQYITRGQDEVTVTVTTESYASRFQSGLKQFLEEARNVASLQDIKGVVEITNFFEANGTGYIVMEYLEGMDVKTILKKSGNKKDYEWCRRVILTILDTLREIHKRGILHRDIAPDNIFVTNEGVIKLIDFGAARHSEALADLDSEIVLKVGYAPIEQYSRTAKQGPYTDLYAIAAVFYRMLTGQKPIPANERVHNDTLVTPTEMGVDLPEQAEMAIMVSLNVQPQYRLQSAEDFMEILDGKDFVPVYEPKWILPPVEEKKTVWDLPLSVKVAICCATIAVVIGAVAGGTLLVRNSSKKRDHLDAVAAEERILVPDYEGKQYKQIQQEIDQLLNGRNSVVYEFSSEPEGTVIRQVPNPGEIAATDVVTLYVSGGESQYTMENFDGRDRNYILRWFEKYNFVINENAFPGAGLTNVAYEPNSEYVGKTGTVDLIYTYSDQYAMNLCAGQSVPAGEICKATDNITITVSCGKATDFEIPIPNLIGKSEKEANKILKDCGLKDTMNIQFELEKLPDTEGREVKVGKIQEQSVTEGYVYNRLENIVYRYENGERTDVKADNSLVLKQKAVIVVTTEEMKTKKNNSNPVDEIQFEEDTSSQKKSTTEKKKSSNSNLEILFP